MKPIYRNALMVGVLAAAGVAAFAESDRGECRHDAVGGYGPMMGGQAMEKMHAQWEKRAAQLKKQLKLTSAQEGAWSTFASAMKPPADKKMYGQEINEADLAKLSTPQRIDKIHNLHEQHMKDMSDRMARRAEAVKTFYAVLSPEQQKIFDAEFMNMKNMQRMRAHGREGKERGEHAGH